MFLQQFPDWWVNYWLLNVFSPNVYSVVNNFLPRGGGGGGCTWAWQGGSRFWDFQSDWVPILYLNTIRLTPSFCKKKSVCLYHI